VWAQPKADLSSIQRVAVVYDSHDGALRRTVEDTMVHRLLQRGIQATPSYSVLDPAAMADTAHARPALASAGFDGVVEIRFIGKTEEPSGPYYMNTYDGWGYWGWGGPYSYGYYGYDSPTVTVETSLYSLHDNQLVWSARSQTTDADNTKKVVNEVTSLVASTLEKRGVPATTARR